MPSGSNGSSPLVDPPESNTSVPGLLLTGDLPPAEALAEALADGLVDVLADALALGEAVAGALLDAEALVVLPPRKGFAGYAVRLEACRSAL